jgi:deoxyribodipyrimidine photolyase-related protein
LHCLDTVVADVWREGYGHHITRLMVLANLGTLLGLEPRALTDWFWVAYADAYDWVVEPNVLGMGTFATGELMTTKPYVSGAAYLARMSDYCGECAFDPARSCPITRLYWAFLGRNAETLRRNPRVAGPVSAALKRSDAERTEDRRVLTVVRDTLARGEALTPARLRASDTNG